jgi:hypothetical protein
LPPMSARQNKAVGAWSSQKKEVDKHFVSFFEGVERDIAQVRQALLQQHVVRGLQQVLTKLVVCKRIRWTRESKAAPSRLARHTRM